MITCYCDMCRKKLTSEDINIIKINDDLKNNMEICNDCLNKVKKFINENLERRYSND